MEKCRECKKCKNQFHVKIIKKKKEKLPPNLIEIDTPTRILWRHSLKIAPLLQGPKYFTFRITPVPSSATNLLLNYLNRLSRIIHRVETVWQPARTFGQTHVTKLREILHEIRSHGGGSTVEPISRAAYIFIDSSWKKIVGWETVFSAWNLASLWKRFSRFFFGIFRESRSIQVYYIIDPGYWERRKLLKFL